MAVRDVTLFYADTADDVVKLAASRSHKPGDVHAIELKGCRVAECPAETDGAHWAFTLITSKVMLTCFETFIECSAHDRFAGTRAAFLH